MSQLVRNDPHPKRHPDALLAKTMVLYHKSNILLGQVQIFAWLVKTDTIRTYLMWQVIFLISYKSHVLRSLFLSEPFMKYS